MFVSSSPHRGRRGTPTASKGRAGHHAESGDASAASRRARDQDPRRAPAASPRRTPKQDRSRALVDAVLAASRELIGTRGNDAVSMREIAARAGVPISSVYQYFPDQSAVLRALMEECLSRVRARMLEAFAQVRAASDLPGAASDSVAGVFALFRDEPHLSTLWAAAQANQSLVALDAEDSRLNAEWLTAQILAKAPRVSRGEVFAACYLATHITGPVIRLALTIEPTLGHDVVREFQRWIVHRLTELTAEGPRPPSRGRRSR